MADDLVTWEETQETARQEGERRLAEQVLRAIEENLELRREIERLCREKTE